MHINELSADGDILHQIIYRGEGNSGIVIALRDRAKVIRLLKKDGKIMRSSPSHDVSQHQIRNVEFIHRIIRPLTDPSFIGETNLIYLDSKFMHELSGQVQGDRPPHRIDKTITLDDQYALLMDDLCALPQYLTSRLQADDLIGPMISIEIKPKQGFIPSHGFAMKPSNQQAHSLTKNCCLYGLTQYLKLARGKICRRSEYCPLDLFSGCPFRMKSALESLIAEPQNNFRIFKNLTFAYGEGSQQKLANVVGGLFPPETGAKESLLIHSDQTTESVQDRLVDLLIQCLLDHHQGRQNKIASGDENLFNPHPKCSQHSIKVRCNYCDCETTHKKIKLENAQQAHVLPESSVLHNVLRAQKLDDIGAHSASKMLNWLEQNAVDRKDIHDKLNKPNLPKGLGLSHQLPHETQEDYYFRKVWEFLVSLTAKDCSIMITIQRLSSRRLDYIFKNQLELRTKIVKERNSEQHYIFNVGIADLDQKTPLKISRICDHLNLSQSIAGRYNESASGAVVMGKLSTKTKVL